MLALTAIACLLFSAPCADPQPLEALRTYLATPGADRKPIADQPFATAPLSREDAATAADLLYADSLARLKAERTAEWNAKSITAAGQTMKFDYRTFGEKPKRGRALFISMHGGGSAPAAVNESQWKNQIGLYKPAEGVYLAPRAPTDSWNMWHQAHIDALFDRLIEDAVACADVDPDRIYLMGYSAGGDGVYQLAPRMADRFAAASMMAGHPNDASPLGLRNLPFAIHVGEKDDGFNRNKVAREWGEKLDKLQRDDPDPERGYIHSVKLHEGRGHWMNREDAEAIPWMTQFHRWPFSRVVWHQSSVTHTRLYWLVVDAQDAKSGADITALSHENTFTIAAPQDLPAITILLGNNIRDFRDPVFVKARVGDRTVDRRFPPPTRSIAALAQSLAERPFDRYLYPARITVDLSKDK